MQIIGPTPREINGILYDLSIIECALINRNDELKLFSFITSSKDTIEYYCLKHEIIERPKKISFALIEGELLLRLSPMKAINVNQDMPDFLDKEITIIEHIERKFPGWLGQYLNSPIIQQLFLRIKPNLF